MKIIEINHDISTYKDNQDRLRLLVCNYLESFMSIEDIEMMSEDILLEPLIFFNIYNKKESYPIEQITLGYYINDSLNMEIDKFIRDSNGYIYFPRLGYIHDDNLRVIEIRKGELFDSITKNKIKVLPLKYINETGIEILQYIPPIYKTIPEQVEYSNLLIEQYEPSLQKAFDVIKNNNKELYSLIILTIRNVSFFSSKELNSFDTIQMHGACFFNVTIVPYVSEVFFLEDIAHQSAHVIFNTLTLDSNDFLTVDKNYISSFDNRPIYIIYHAVYTYCFILDVLDKYIENEGYTNDTNKIEAIARIGFLEWKINLDMSLLKKEKYFTSKGESIFNEMSTSCEKIEAKYKGLFSKYNYQNQPYNFDFNLFRLHND